MGSLRKCQAGLKISGANTSSSCVNVSDEQKKFYNNDTSSIRINGFSVFVFFKACTALPGIAPTWEKNENDLSGNDYDRIPIFKLSRTFSYVKSNSYYPNHFCSMSSKSSSNCSETFI